MELALWSPGGGEKPRNSQEMLRLREGREGR
jgi:hypothetical protein